MVVEAVEVVEVVEVVEAIEAVEVVEVANATADTPKLTGVPPHVLIMADIRRFENKLDTIGKDLLANIVEDLNKRDIGGGMHHALEIQKELQLLRDELKSLELRTNGERVNDSNDNVNGESSSNVDLYKYHFYNGKHSRLPENFEFPSLTLSSFISCYFLGNKTLGLPPLRLLSVFDIVHSHRSVNGSKQNRKIITDMIQMMKFVEKAARDAGVWESDPSKWTAAKLTNLYEKTKHRFQKPPKKGKRQFEAILWKTFLNMLKNKEDGGLVPFSSENAISTAL